MRRFLNVVGIALAVVALSAQMAAAQLVTAPAYRSPGQGVQGATGVICLNLDGSSCGFGGSTAFSPTDASGTIASGGNFQQVFAQNLTRANCFIQNPTSASEPLYVHWTAAGASTANSASLGPGSSFSCAGNGTVVTGIVQVSAATTGHAFVAAGA